MKLLKYLFIFLGINFTALALGTLSMANGPQTNWYTNLNKAPWTPPGYIFGAAWTGVMVCFSIYMAYLYKAIPRASVIGLFSIQFLLNVVWNYIFFNLHLVGLGLTVLLLLTFVIILFTFSYLKTMKVKTLLVLPYLLWLCIATSLNAYILLLN